MGIIMYRNQCNSFRIIQKEENSMRRNIGVLLILTSLGSVFLFGCTRRPSEEEMRRLSDLKAEVTSLQKQVTDREAAKANLQKQLAAKEDRMKWCAGEQDAVKQRLQNWK
jgi:septal ring factor EnvC (AmiA/AmiB activator)